MALFPVRSGDTVTERRYLWMHLNRCSQVCYTHSCAAAALEANTHCLYLSTPLSYAIVSFVCSHPQTTTTTQGDVELEPSRGAKCSAAVRRLGTPGSATGKNYTFHDVPGFVSAFLTADVSKLGFKPPLLSDTCP